MKTGIVFDIQRFSLHDGPGIRTTVFLKGCPLHCSWCHNPEAISAQPQLAYRADLCDHCLACVRACPNEAHYAMDCAHVYDRALCQACGACVDACPQQALRLFGKSMAVDEVMAIVDRDRAYYDRSGGGLTLSGGEPLAQYGFTRELLEAAKRVGIHTCIETCGSVAPERLSELIPLVDVFLFDYKATDPALHLELTGVDNRLILSNLHLLLERGAHIVLRCPLVPGINDQPEHLQAIAALSALVPAPERIEIMAYHDLGKSKAEQIGSAAGRVSISSADEAVKLSWLESLHNNGCLNIDFG
jgi:pyruvate formate lyase activating enzyme